MAEIKNFLKRFLPTSSATMHAYVVELDNKIAEAREATLNSFKELNRAVASIDARLLQICDQIETNAELLATLEERLNNLSYIDDKNDRRNAEQFKQITDKQASLEQLLSEQADSIKSTNEELKRDVLQQIEWWTWERFLRTDAAINTQTETLKNEINTGFSDISVDNKTFYWDNAYEKAAIQNNWGDLQQDPGLPNRYFKLISGLDEKSIATVNSILFRQSRYLTSNATTLDLFTKEEQKELHTIADVFSKEVTRIADNIYAFRHYLLPINHFEPVVFYYKYCLSELDHIDQVKGKTIIDAGAYIGDTALIFSELNPDKIVSFEPVPGNMQLLKQTIAMNGLTNVIPEEAALGAESGEMEFYIAGEGSTSLPREEDRGFYEPETIDVPVITLDEYVAEHNLEIGLIKADLEGGEIAFLKGGRRTIEAQRPALLICIYHNRNDFFNIKTMLEEWNLNYRFKIRKPVVPNATYETLLIGEYI